MPKNPWSGLSSDTYLLTTGEFCVFTALGINAFILPFYLLELNVSLSSLGFIFAFSPLIFGAFRFVFGSLGDRFDRRKLLWTSTVITTGQLFAYPWVRGVPIFASLSMVKGFSSSLRSGSITPLILVCNPEEKKGTALAINASSQMGGMALGYAIGGFLLATTSYLWIFTLAGIISIISMFVFLKVKANCDIIPDNKPLRDVFSIRKFNRNTIIMVLAFLISGMAVAFGESFALPLTLRQDFLLEPQLIGIVLAFGWLIQSAPGFTIPQYNDRFNPRWLTGIGSIICGILFFGIVLTYSLWYFIALFLLYNLIVAIVLNNRWVIIGDAARSQSIGKDTAIASLGFGVGSFTGSFFAGILAEFFGFSLVYAAEGFLWILHGLIVIVLIIGYPSIRKIRSDRGNNNQVK